MVEEVKDARSRSGSYSLGRRMGEPYSEMGTPLILMSPLPSWSPRQHVPPPSSPRTRASEVQTAVFFFPKLITCCVADIYTVSGALARAARTMEVCRKKRRANS